MNFRKSRKLMWIGFIVGIFIMTVGTSFEDEKVIGFFVAVGGIIFVLSLIQAFIFCTCPNCGYSLMNVRGALPKHCPECGENLEEE